MPPPPHTRELIEVAAKLMPNDVLDRNVTPLARRSQTLDCKERGTRFASGVVGKLIAAARIVSNDLASGDQVTL